MDLRDLFKILWRRWYLLAPVLVLTAIGTAAVVASQRPLYTVQASIILMPPTNPLATARPNPLVEVGVHAMAQSVKATATSKHGRQRIADAGYAPVYNLLVQAQSPVIDVAYTDPSAAHAQAAVAQVMRLIADEVAAAQAPYNPAPGHAITTRVLNPQGTVTPSTAHIKRKAIVFAGFGVLAGAALTVLVDGHLVRRARRRAEVSVDAVYATGRAQAPVSVH